MNNKELQSLINDLKAKLPGNMTAELIDDEQPGQAAEPQSEPGPALPDELIAMVSKAFEEAAKEVFGEGIASTQVTQVSAADGSPEAQEAMRAMLRNMMPQRPQCYHYILDAQGQPVHCEDDEEMQKFQRSKKDILAAQSFDCLGMEMRLTTRLVVHNPMTGNEPPKPRWVTELRRVDTGECGFRKFSHDIDEAWAQHRAACKETQRVIAEQTEESAESENGNA